MPSANHLIHINAPVEAVRSAFTTLEGLRNWWTENAQILSPSPLIYEFRFTSGASNKMKVIREEQNEVEWECVDGASEWIGTHVIFHVEANENKASTLKFSHSRWEAETDYFAMCNTFWGQYMEKIKTYAEALNDRD